MDNGKLATTMGDLMSFPRFITTGLSAVAGLAAAAVLLSPSLASASVSGLGSYSSWARAQHAAGFRLMRPSTTYGLKMNGKIIVDQCVVSSKLGDRVVDVQYGSLLKHALGLEQDNAGVSCTAGSSGTYLGSYKINGAAARLYGECGSVAPQYSCSSAKIALWLSWRSGRYYYIASSFNESRARLVRFARSLRRI
jgi:hypothetical protein